MRKLRLKLALLTIRKVLYWVFIFPLIGCVLGVISWLHMIAGLLTFKNRLVDAFFYKHTIRLYRYAIRVEEKITAEINEIKQHMNLFTIIKNS